MNGQYSTIPFKEQGFLNTVYKFGLYLQEKPPIQWVPGAHSLGVKRSGREADYSPATSAEVKKTWIYTSTPSYAFME
jgi:hypothetical protein